MTFLTTFSTSNFSIDKAHQHNKFLTKVMTYSEKLSIKKGQKLKMNDESSQSLYYIDEGAIDVSYHSSGSKIVVALIGTNEFFGEIGFFDGISRVRDISATENTILNVFSKNQVEKMQISDPQLHGRFVTLLTTSICKKFRRVLKEREPLKTYAASLSTEPHRVTESAPLPTNFFDSKEGKFSHKVVEELKAKLFNLSHQIQLAPSQKSDHQTKEQFKKVMDTFFKALEGYYPYLEKAKMKNEVWGFLFKETFPYFMRSSLAERAYFKPNGYAGDFKMIEMMYQNKPSGDGAFGKLVDEWLLNRPPCCAVRGRRLFLKNMLLEKSDHILRTKENVKIMNLACGPSRELFDFIKEFDQDDKVMATCLDIDPQALQYTDQLSRSFSHNSQIRVMEDNLIKWALGTSTQKIEKQDIIYSGGLFDYLDDSLFLKLANKCHEYLNIGGILVIGNFKPNPDQIFMDNILEWRLIYRTPDDLHSILSKSKFGGKIEIMEEKVAKIQLFAKVVKE